MKCHEERIQPLIRITTTIKAHLLTLRNYAQHKCGTRKNNTRRTMRLRVFACVCMCVWPKCGPTLTNDARHVEHTDRTLSRQDNAGCSALGTLYSALCTLLMAIWSACVAYLWVHWVTCTHICTHTHMRHKVQRPTKQWKE